MPSVPIHSCINLFWNPLNKTFEAFQRNALLRAAESRNQEDGFLYILEIDAEKLLEESQYYWCATCKNAASAPQTSYDIALLKDQRIFRWDLIFATGAYSQEAPHQHRAAEFIVFKNSETDGYTSALPPTMIKRVLSDATAPLVPDLAGVLAAADIAHHQVGVFKPVANLLNAECKFVATTGYLKQVNPQAITRLIRAATIVVDVESSYGGPTAALFSSPELAYGQHGVGHAARVMFWSGFLASSIYSDGTSDSVRACVAAALIHDVCRTHHLEDEIHGDAAAMKHGCLVARIVSDNRVIDSCLNAVRMHCRPDSLCAAEKQDSIWQIMKDADALDRGRFSPPNRERGCSQKMLRVPELKPAKDQYARVPWLAYWLANMTRHSMWGERPCRRLVRDMYFGIKELVGRNLISGSDLTLAKELLAELENHVPQLLKHEPEPSGLLDPGDYELPHYDIYDDMEGLGDGYEGDDEEERLWQEEAEREYEEWLDDDDFNDWDDHDCDDDGDGEDASEDEADDYLDDEDDGVAGLDDDIEDN